MRIHVRELTAGALAVTTNVGVTALPEPEPAVVGPPGSAADPSCATIFAAGKYPTWQQLPTQTTLPDPFLPLAKTTTDSGNAAADIMAGRAAGRVASRDEWLRCRRPEILSLLQEYQYGYYPDAAAETVRATRSGTTVNIEVTAGGKTGKFKATLALPSGASASAKAPVVINIGGMQNQPYLQAGIAVVGFDYTSVAADSNSKTGAFWDVYKGRDIGRFACCFSVHRNSPYLKPPRHIILLLSMQTDMEYCCWLLTLSPPSSPPIQASSPHGPGASTGRSTR
jgi:hypothetical protein